MTAYEFYMLRRSVLHLHQITLSKEIGKSRRTVSRYENGEIEVPFLVAQRMIDLAKEVKAKRSTTAPALPSLPGPPADSDASAG